MKRFHRRCTFGVLAMAGAMMLAALPCHASKSAAEFFEPIITHRQYSTFVQSLQLDQDQRFIAELLFTDYADAIEALAAEADAAADTVGRQTVLEAFSGRRLVDPDELRRLRLEVLQVYQDYWPRIDDELEKLIDGVLSLLTSERRGETTESLRKLRRQTLLHPRQASRMSFEYAGDGVDMLQLIDLAANDAELSTVPADALQRISSTYAAQMDALLQETAGQHRALRMQMRTARIRRDREAVSEAERAMLELWRQVYDLNERTMRQAGEMAAAHGGESARAAWRARFQEASFPWLQSTATPDRQYEWVLRQTLTDEQRERAEQAYEQFRQARRELRDAAISIMLTARMDLQCILYAMMDQAEVSNRMAVPLHEQLLRNSGELARAEANATAAFESLLTDSQRAAMRRTIRR